MDNDVPSNKSRRLSVGDKVSFSPLIMQKYAIKATQYMVISNHVDWETFPCAVITDEGKLFFFAEYEVL